MKHIYILSLLLILGSVSPGNANTNSKWILEERFNQDFITLNDLDIITPEELKEALARYNKGEYKYAADLLQKLRKINLPDGQLDFIAFALGECYRKLGV
ncbi:MAG: hypothetical protein GX640_13630, partial [Fibrobacter sp.]|nr:hypothetical protein [Fibrobacter sp.]